MLLTLTGAQRGAWASAGPTVPRGATYQNVVLSTQDEPGPLTRSRTSEWTSAPHAPLLRPGRLRFLPSLLRAARALLPGLLSSLVLPCASRAGGRPRPCCGPLLHHGVPIKVLDPDPRPSRTEGTGQWDVSVAKDAHPVLAPLFLPAWKGEVSLPACLRRENEKASETMSSFYRDVRTWLALPGQTPGLFVPESSLSAWPPCICPRRP